MPVTRIATAAVLTLFVMACNDRSDSALTSPGQQPSLSVSNNLGGAFDASRDRVANRIAARLAHTALSGGPLTVFDQTSDAFSIEAPGLSSAEHDRHVEGDDAFEQEFIPGASPDNGGLGPIFDNTSCLGCHVGDGRGRPPVGPERFESMLFRASVPGVGAHGGPAPVPGFGGQLQMRAIPGLQPGVVATLTYRDSVGHFTDGTTYSLRVPSQTFTNAYTPLPGMLLVSPRVAPAVFGLGLLENVPDVLIVARADPNDRNRDGISGRPNITWDVIRGRPVLGRFGWKANVGSLMQQTAGAYNGDMGITSLIFPAEPCEGFRPGCERHDAEISTDLIEATAFYQATLGVPARRRLDDATVQLGEEVFYDAGCGSCHTSTLISHPAPGASPARLRVAAIIHPYTDLLLHDMGAALADNRPDFQASGSEWRTAPLWGIGLIGQVNGHTNFLHDGRARSLLEAVLWHGGEAERSRESVRALPATLRNALIEFLGSL